MKPNGQTRNRGKAELMRCAGAVLAGVFLASGDAAWAQGGQQQSDSGISFNLTTPGARSLAMGGAFLGLADDATAAYTNPAGLANLTEGGSQVALEVRGWQYSNVFLEGGHLEGTPSGLGVNAIPGPLNGEAENSTQGLSFVSVGYVLPGGTPLALYRQELANFVAETESQGAFYGNVLATVPDENGNPIRQVLPAVRFLPSRRETELSIVSYGLSAAHEFEISLGKAENQNQEEKPGARRHLLALGAGVSYYQFDLSSRREVFNLRDPRFPLSALENQLPGGFFGPPDFLPGNVLFRESRDGEDTDLGFSFGWLWKIARSNREEGKKHSPRWSIGGVYRRGPEFRAEERGADREGNSYRLARSFKVPDVYGIGVAYSTAQGATKVTFDYDRVLYSQRLDDEIPVGFGDPEGLRIKDADQIHAGVEHSFPLIGQELVLTLRGGAWYEPNHDLEYVGSDQCICTLFGTPGEDDAHVSFGFGLVSGESFEIDTAADFSDRTNTVSISLVKFF